MHKTLYLIASLKVGGKTDTVRFYYVPIFMVLHFSSLEINTLLNVVFIRMFFQYSLSCHVKPLLQPFDVLPLPLVPKPRPWLAWPPIV